MKPSEARAYVDQWMEEETIKVCYGDRLAKLLRNVVEAAERKAWSTAREKDNGAQWYRWITCEDWQKERDGDS